MSSGSLREEYAWTANALRQAAFIKSEREFINGRRGEV